MQHSYNIYFLAKNIGNNYLHDPQAYSRLCNGSFNHIVYYYWILKNNLCVGSKYEIFLVDELPSRVNSTDIVIFYYDTAEKVRFNECITIQAVGDKPIIAKSNFIITHNLAMKELNTFFIHLPLPYNIRKQTPSFPPKNFVGVGALHSFNKEITSEIFKHQCRGQGINFELITDKNFCDKNADVFVFLRDKNLPLYERDDGTPLHPASIWSPFKGDTHRHANRLYQSWYMNTPLIHNRESSIEAIVKSKYDILYAETPRELVLQMLFLQNNKTVFNKMIETCKRREGENTHDVIVDQFMNMLNIICQ